MLIDFRVANFRSFEEEQVVNLVAGNDQAHPSNLIECGQFKLVKAAAIFGPNASGKSNLIKAIRFFEEFIRVSATSMNQGDRIGAISPFRLDSNTRKLPSSFAMNFTISETRYEYGFSATNDRVHDEWLYVYPSPTSRINRWLERRFDAASNATKWIFRGPLKRDEKMLQERTRDNGLVLSLGAQLNIKELATVFSWFRDNVMVYDLSERPTSLMQRTAGRIDKDEAFRARVTNFLKDADLGLSDLRIDKESLPAFYRGEMPDEIRRRIADMRRANPNAVVFAGPTASFYSVNTFHRHADDEEMEKFSMQDDESNGTQRVFAIAGPFFEALDKGHTLVVDEFECSLHPELARALVRLFQSQEFNKNGAQIIFATHELRLMDEHSFRRDQLWLVDKNIRGASSMQSLCDIKSRSNEAFQRNYTAGRYGGMPQFGPTFEDVEE